MDEALLGAGEVAIVTRAFLLLEAWPPRARSHGRSPTGRLSRGSLCGDMGKE